MLESRKRKFMGKKKNGICLGGMNWGDGTGGGLVGRGRERGTGG